MTPMYFCYEREDNGQWTPVVYRTNFGEPKIWPPDRERTELVEGPDECIGPDREPQFGALKARFTPPRGDE
ncbi:hypothetical protein C5748_18305 [Phyllobacterium phragmitis]|uniref:Uncharacterized protein n=1 Tax=Phyllobacterium phragmitis TaxID=2670329 RepID=A0A2S9INK9_9HYPH|nr:hypothetical protein [Phyllobacterium phragmitis]PRD42105.1 hypothetical protein C5748_18305 [Phyllobacterium phragmitis]